MAYVWINLGFALVAIVALFAVLRLLDLISGNSFRNDLLPIIKANPLAVALYRGSWVVACAHLIGAMLGV